MAAGGVRGIWAVLGERRPRARGTIPSGSGAEGQAHRAAGEAHGGLIRLSPRASRSLAVETTSQAQGLSLGLSRRRQAA
eukprot:scaffold24_cov245-Pinguiococcus_pyrenoidosus.AAC.31